MKFLNRLMIESRSLPGEARHTPKHLLKRGPRIKAVRKLIRVMRKMGKLK